MATGEAAATQLQQAGVGPRAIKPGLQKTIHDHQDPAGSRHQADPIRPKPLEGQKAKDGQHEHGGHVHTAGLIDHKQQLPQPLRDLLMQAIQQGSIPGIRSIGFEAGTRHQQHRRDGQSDEQAPAAENVQPLANNRGHGDQGLSLN